MAKTQKVGTGSTAVEIKEVDLARIDAAEYNPREISEDALVGLTASISRFGYVEPIIVNKRSTRQGWPKGSKQTIVGGHQRTQSLIVQGEKTAPAVLVDLDEADEVALNVQLNNPEIQGSFTFELADRLDEIRAGIGEDEFVEQRLDLLRKSIGEDDGPPAGDEGAAGDDGKPKPITKKGDVYRLGNHVLECADPKAEPVLERLSDVSDPDAALWLVVKSPKECDSIVEKWQLRTGEIAEKADPDADG